MDLKDIKDKKSSQTGMISVLPPAAKVRQDSKAGVLRCDCGAGIWRCVAWKGSGTTWKSSLPSSRFGGGIVSRLTVEKCLFRVSL